MANKGGWQLENNVDKVIKKIKDKPYKVMNIIGQNLVREIKATTLSQNYKQRSKFLKKGLGYWARKQEKDLQIGFKISIQRNIYGAGPGIVGGIMTGSEPDPIKPVVMKNKDMIQELIATALDEIRKE